MPTFDHHDVHIHYTDTGAGHPVLCIAPGGMRSAAALWRRSPWNPVERLVHHRVIAMDQRNAGHSTGPLGAGWDDYTRDQLALLDHLGIETFDIVGMCIGGAYIANLCRLAPDRVHKAVMLQPIGLHDNRDAFYEMYDAWAAGVPGSAADKAALRHAMWSGDFLFAATREQVAAIPHPLLVLMGDDLYHPQSTSRDIVQLAPHATLVERWKHDADATDRAIQAFLA